ncbi:MAG: hypothetical protein R3A13_11220 [Bdellovibrionota bacterium]
MKPSRLLVLICIFLSSCLSTSITTPEIDPTTYRLLAAANRRIGLIVNSNIEQNSKIGKQYLFVFIPFGDIKYGNAKHVITNSAFEQLGLLNYKAVLVEKPSETTLVIDIENIELKALDYLIIRKIVCNLELSARLLDQNGQIIASTKAFLNKSNYKKFAFRQELEYSFSKAVDEAVAKILLDLNHFLH